MTRINLVEPRQLTNIHAMAEYRELPRIFTAVLKLQEQGITPDQVCIPDSYVLGAGHVKFFYNKLHWLERRYVALKDNLEYRGYNIDYPKFRSVWEDAHLNFEGTEWWGSYLPSPEDFYLNMARICRRSKVDKVLFELQSNN